MDIQSDGAATQPISDDQELAKVLAGIAEDQTPPAPAPAAPTPAFIPTPAQNSAPAPAHAPNANIPTPPPAGDLENIRLSALNELRPLIDHVQLPSDEKFDTYLMLIRSTDDASLLGPAHAVAQSIKDEKRRAEALLDIVKEIDFLSQKVG